MSKTSINGADGEANWSGVVNFHCERLMNIVRLMNIYLKNNS